MFLFQIKLLPYITGALVIFLQIKLLHSITAIKLCSSVTGTTQSMFLLITGIQFSSIAGTTQSMFLPITGIPFSSIAGTTQSMFLFKIIIANETP